MPYQPAPTIYEGFCPIEPVPKGRPRFSYKTNTTYTPAATRKYEDAVRKWLMQHYGQNRAPMDGCLSVYYEFVLARPKSISKKKKMSNTKPDIDNLIKAFQDAFDFKIKSKDGVALGVIANDSRVSAVQACKRYTRGEETPGTYFKIRSAITDAIIYSGVQDEMLELFDMTKQLISFDDIEQRSPDNDVENVYLFMDTDDIGTEVYETIQDKFPMAKTCFVI